MAYRTIGQIIEHDGYLAQYRGDRIEYDGVKAWHVEQVAVSRSKTSDDDGPVHLYAQLIGKQVLGGNWSGYVATDWSQVYVDTSGWVWPETRTEIARPRDSKLYTWKWSDFGRAWRKELWSSRCDTCGQYHNPDLIPCETCGSCHQRAGEVKPCAR